MPLHLWFEAPPRQHPALGPHGHRARARRELKGTRPQVCVELSLTARLAPVVTVQARERIAKGGGLEIDRDTPRYPEITRGCGSPKAADLRCSTAWEGSAVAPTFATRPPTLHAASRRPTRLCRWHPSMGRPTHVHVHVVHACCARTFHEPFVGCGRHPVPRAAGARDAAQALEDLPEPCRRRPLLRDTVPEGRPRGLTRRVHQVGSGAPRQLRLPRPAGALCQRPRALASET